MKAPLYLTCTMSPPSSPRSHLGCGSGKSEMSQSSRGLKCAPDLTAARSFVLLAMEHLLHASIAALVAPSAGLPPFSMKISIKSTKSGVLGVRVSHVCAHVAILSLSISLLILRGLLGGRTICPFSGTFCPSLGTFCPSVGTICPTENNFSSRVSINPKVSNFCTARLAVLYDMTKGIAAASSR